jgi:hypothetical protein
MDSYKIAAIDVHKSMLAVVVTDAAVEGELPFERRKFGALGSDLKALTTFNADDSEKANHSIVRLPENIFQEHALSKQRSFTGS